MLRKAGLVALLVFPVALKAAPDPVPVALQPVPSAPFVSRISPQEGPVRFALGLSKSLGSSQPGGNPICDILRKVPPSRPGELPFQPADIFAAARSQQGCEAEPG